MPKLDFYIYYKNELMGHVWLGNDLSVNHESYSNDPFKNPMIGTPKNVEGVLYFLERRCTSRHNAGIREILDILEISEYDPISIIRKTHGIMIHDFNWIRFADEPVYKWEEFECVKLYNRF